MTGSTARTRVRVAEAVDGRTARATRTNEAVVDALLSLIEEGDLRPAAQRIADRAGVSLRSVFHHFQDLETLYATAAERQIRRLPLPVLPPADAPLAKRISALVAGRAAVFEAITPVRRAALLNEPFSPTLADRLQRTRDTARDDVARVFDAELGGFKAEERRETLAAVVAVAEWSTWEALRAHQGLSIAQARRVMVRAIGALLREA